MYLQSKFALYGFLNSDIDECSTAADNCLDSPGVCTNTDGSFICGCMSGYTGNGVTACDGIHNSELFYLHVI